MLIRKITPEIIPNTGDSRRPDIRLIADLVPIHRLRDAEDGTADTQPAVRLELAHHIGPDSARRIIDFAVIPSHFGGIKFQPLHNQYPVAWCIAQGPVRILLVKAQLTVAVKAVADPQDLRRKCAVSLSEYADTAFLPLMGDIVHSYDVIRMPAVPCRKARRGRQKKDNRTQEKRNRTYQIAGQ